MSPKYNSVTGWIVSYYDNNSFFTGEKSEYPDKTFLEVKSIIKNDPNGCNYKAEVAQLSDPIDPVFWWNGKSFQEV